MNINDYILFIAHYYGTNDFRKFNLTELLINNLQQPFQNIALEN